MDIEIFQQFPIIASAIDDESLDKILMTDIPVVFILYGDIMTLPEIAKKIKKAEKYALVHLDTIAGLANHESVLDYVKEVCKVDGIITTKRNLIAPAKKRGLFTIIRFFTIDFTSVGKACDLVQAVKPDMVEVMPALATKVIENLKMKIDVPIIAGGLLNTKKEVIAALSAGALCVSAAMENVWEF